MMPYLNSDYSEYLVRVLGDKFTEEKFNWIKRLTGIHKLGLLFHTFGGQYRIDHSVRIYANPFSPFAEPVAVPFQIFLVVFRHMFRDSAVLPRTPLQTAVGSNAVMIVKNFNSGICYLDINFLFDVFIGN